MNEDLFLWDVYLLRTLFIWLHSSLLLSLSIRKLVSSSSKRPNRIAAEVILRCWEMASSTDLAARLDTTLDGNRSMKSNARCRLPGWPEASLFHLSIALVSSGIDSLSSFCPTGVVVSNSWATALVTLDLYLDLPRSTISDSRSCCFIAPQKYTKQVANPLLTEILWQTSRMPRIIPCLIRACSLAVIHLNYF